MTGEDHTIFAASTFFGVVVIFVCLFLGLALKKYKIYALPEAACTMIVGFFVGCFLVAFFPTHSDMFTFSPSVFFFILLPPIIFEAGYTLKRSDFFTNLGAILLYAIVGTIITCIVIGVGLFIAAANDLVPLDSSSPIEAFQFGSLIAATDTVATIAILSSEELAADPLLYSLVFGESVLNDAVAIVLYKTFDSFHSVPFSWTTLFQAGLLFLGVSVGSAVAGLFVALVCCFVFRKFNFSEYPVYEFTLIALFAYCSYFLAEVCNLSGIMGIFFCAVGMAHYNYYNISGNARIATHDGFKSIAQICDTFTFIYIGVTAGISVGPNSSELIYSPVLIVLTVLFMLIGRCANIFFLNIFINPNRTLRIPFRMQIVQWFAGMRGSVAFALALNFPGDNHEYVVTSTLAVVILSTIIIGACTLPLLKLTGMTQSNIQGDEVVQNKRFVVKKFIAWWLSFDKNYMRKWFGDPADRHLRVGNFHAHDHESGVDEHDVEHVINKLRKSSRSHSHGGGGVVGEEEEKTAAEQH